jgi:tetratricopeptide (TPR) repeat protein
VPHPSPPPERVPEKTGAAAPTREPAAIELRLAIGRDGVGLELARPTGIGCLLVTDLAASLPGSRFPLDVSGGVSRFRHRRGRLERLELELGARALEGWAAAKLGGLIGPSRPDVWIGVRASGAVVSIATRDDPVGTRAPFRVLAFDLYVMASGDDLAFYVAHARGSGLVAPATATAVLAVQGLLGGAGERRGGEIVVRGAGAHVARALLPEAGARAPSVDDLRWTSLAATSDAWILQSAREGAPPEPSPDALQAREATAILREADQARIEGHLDKARALDLAALERAPRHPEVSRRIAEIDQLAGGRAEAALATLVDSERSPGASLGMLVAELLRESGDAEAAIATFARVGESDPAPALGARAFEQAAELTRDHLEALEWLDRAVARAPRASRLRWARLDRRLRAGRLEDALADAEHLEAMASGAAQKHAVLRRAGEAWLRAGLRVQALSLFERALRYAPDAPDALAGLGSALVAEGRTSRGAAILARAVELAEARREPTSATVVELARTLAERLDDLPAAIARVRAVPNESVEALEARGLEGRWRSRLGDFAGATLAFARLRDLAESRPESGSEGAKDDAVDFLLEAAAFERTRRGDLPTAQRHLAAALRLRPRDPGLRKAYAEIGEALAPAPSAAPRPAPQVAPELPMRDEPSTGVARRLDLSLDSAPPADPGAEARAEELTRRLQADPTDDDVAAELVEVLESLGRTHELLALLSARLEDATGPRRAELVPHMREVLGRLEQGARAAGRNAEAQLFRDALAQLDA